MKKFITDMYKKYEEIIVYLIVGVIATIVSWGAKFLWNYLFYENTMDPNEYQTAVLSVVNWVSGVGTAYPLNRKYVFKSHGPIGPEAAKFCGSRVSTWVLDLVLTMVLGPFMGIDLRITTFISAVLVTILNYVFSKLIVFKGKKPEDGGEGND